MNRKIACITWIVLLALLLGSGGATCPGHRRAATTPAVATLSLSPPLIDDSNAIGSNPPRRLSRVRLALASACGSGTTRRTRLCLDLGKSGIIIAPKAKSNFSKG